MSRSFLFIPGNTPSMIQNLDVFESDAIIIDLEDSVVAHDKDAGRVLVEQFLTSFEYKNIDIYVRVNDVMSLYFEDDIATLDGLNFKGYVLPKATPSAVALLQSLTTKDIIPIIESPMGFLRCEEIASNVSVTGLLLGAEDFTKELGIKRTSTGVEIEYIRSHIAIVCSAYRIMSIDTPYTSKEVDDYLELDCKTARLYGMTSKSIIHPNHVETINRVFAPSEEEINQSLRIIKKSEQEQKGAFSLDGQMIDLPIIEKAKKVIELAKKYNLI
jgi:citrate lyase subunit beta/citryl-CoA lyase